MPVEHSPVGEPSAPIEGIGLFGESGGNQAKFGEASQGGTLLTTRVSDLFRDEDEDLDFQGFAVADGREMSVPSSSFLGATAVSSTNSYLPAEKFSAGRVQEGFCREDDRLRQIREEIDRLTLEASKEEMKLRNSRRLEDISTQGKLLASSSVHRVGGLGEEGFCVNAVPRGASCEIDTSSSAYQPSVVSSPHVRFSDDVRTYSSTAVTRDASSWRGSTDEGIYSRQSAQRGFCIDAGNNGYRPVYGNVCNPYPSHFAGGSLSYGSAYSSGSKFGSAHLGEGRSAGDNLLQRDRIPVSSQSSRECFRSAVHDCHRDPRYNGEIGRLAYMISDIQRENKLPKREPAKFSGSELEDYIPFIMEFDSMIVSSCSDEALLYSYLVTYTEGEAGEIVRSCFMEDRVSAYHHSRASLEKRYGNSYLLAHKFLNKLKEWPPIKRDHPEELRRFSLFLRRISNMCQRSCHFEILNSGHELRSIADKLPSHLCSQWARKAYEITSRDRRVLFSDLVMFVEFEADIACQPYFGSTNFRTGSIASTSVPSKRAFTTVVSQGGCDGVEGEAPTELVSAKPKQTGLARSSSDEEKFKVSASRGQYDNYGRVEPVVKRRLQACWGCGSGDHILNACQEFVTLGEREKSKYLEDRTLCVYCHRRHSLEDCSSFQTLSVVERRKFAWDTYLCYACLRVGHRARGCKRGPGDHCLMKRYGSPTGSKGSAKHRPEHVSHVVVADRVGKMSPSVIVDVRAANGSWVRTRVALDAHSSVSFMDKRLARRLKLNGAECQFTLTTFSESAKLRKSEAIRKVGVRTLDGREYNVGLVYSVCQWPFGAEDVPPSSLVRDDVMLSSRLVDSGEYPVEMLVGMDEPLLVKPFESVCTSSEDLYVTRYELGWAVCGNIPRMVPSTVQRCRRVGIDVDDYIRETFAKAFEDDRPLEIGDSVEDSIWRRRVEESLKRGEDGKLEIPLPFRDEEVSLPNNFNQAAGALNGLAKRFSRDPKLADDYTQFMEDLVGEGILEEVPEHQCRGQPGKTFYLCHHSVYHKTKKKIRVVFDCSRKYQGVSLNDVLLQGPDLMNKLVGVLHRFRSSPIAFIGDIRKMFLQLKVPREHANYMRILWWPGGNCNLKPRQYRLTTHTFGAVSSPSIANYAVKWAIDQRAPDVSAETEKTVRSCLYVDDLMGSAETISAANVILRESKEVLAFAGFDLVNIASSSRDVLMRLDRSVLTKDLRELDLFEEELPAGRVLGVYWDVQSDHFSFKVAVPDKQRWTRRTLLSCLASLFDPIGLVVPFVVVARSLFQHTCQQGLGWDDELPDGVLSPWKAWLAALQGLHRCSFPRCIGLSNLGCDRLELHIFCDGSLRAYAAVAYARRLVNGKVVGVHLIQAKARQTPVGRGPLRTVPRIELNAARLAVELAVLLRIECDVVWTEEFFWTDSEVVLAYLSSTVGRFQRFISNRVSFIHSNSSKESWRFVPGKRNVADVASRGTIDINVLTSSYWCNGPSFLQEMNIPAFDVPIVEQDKLETCKTVRIQNDQSEFWTKVFMNVSVWRKMCRRIAILRSFIYWLKCGRAKVQAICADAVGMAERRIWKNVQEEFFGEQLDRIRCSLPVSRGHALEKLCPYIDADGLLKTTGRLGRLAEGERPPAVIILPGKSRLVVAFIRHLHGREGHLGGSHLRAVIAESFHVFGVTCVVNSIVWHCVCCRKAQGRPLQPKMADLPAGRLQADGPPFTYCGIDIFGPFHLKERRSSLKRYGVVFSCLTTRAVHFEVISSLSSNSFLNCFRRFESRRGRPLEVFCDNGTNLVGARRELEDGLKEVNSSGVHESMAARSIKWNFRPPAASHWGGSWEREIRTARKVFWSLFSDRPCRLNDELLSTLMCEVEAIMNRRPITPVQAVSPDMGPLSPVHLLIPGYRAVGLPCNSQPRDVHYVGRWRAVQRYADEFWTRWRKEYITLLRQRVKWSRDAPNLQVGDMVLLTNSNLPRYRWPLGVISKVSPSADGVVRQVVVRAAPPRDEHGVSGCGNVVELIRPVVKLIPVLRVSDI